MLVGIHTICADINTTIGCGIIGSTGGLLAFIESGAALAASQVFHLVAVACSLSSTLSPLLM